MNCARRAGAASVQLLGVSGCRILWLPMSEENKKAACKMYLDIYASDLLASLRDGYTLVVNCQEGVHRSVEFTAQVLSLCDRSSPWCDELGGVARAVVCGTSLERPRLAGIPSSVPEEGEEEGEEEGG